MSLSKPRRIPAGDYLTAEEAVMNNESVIQMRCETIDEVVKDKIFTLTEALDAYNISPEQYVGYRLMQPDPFIKIIFDSDMVISVITSLVNIIDFSSARLDTRTRKVVSDMKQLAGVK